MSNAETTSAPIHVFERAGFGKAPFRVVGNYESKFQAIPGDPSCPMQPGASCDLCAQGIMMVFVICSADGKEHKVGCDCVRRTGDGGLRKQVDAAVAAIRREKTAAKNAAKKADLASVLADESARARLAAVPHPYDHMAAKGHTLLSFAEFALDRAGAAGRAKALKKVTAALK